MTELKTENRKRVWDGERT